MNDIVVPLYCPICDQLSFFKRNALNGFLLEVDHLNWQYHPCYHTHRQQVAESAVVIAAQKHDPESLTISFKHKKSGLSSRTRKLSEGIILEVQTDPAQKTTLKVLTPENNILRIRPLFDCTAVVAGMILNIEDAVRIGKDFYRLKTLFHYPLPDIFTGALTIPDKYYQLTVSSSDQEQLELGIGQLFTFFTANRSIPFMMVPLPITAENDVSIHHRQIDFIPGDNFMKKLKDVRLPEIISLALNQIKNNTSKAVPTPSSP